MGNGVKFSVEMKGLEQMRVALRELPKLVQQKVLEGAVAAGGKVIAKEAKQKVLVDTGLLRRNIRSTRGKRRDSEASAFVTVRRLTKAKIRAYKKATGKDASTNPLDPYYWRVLEFGKSTRTAHPFLRPAFNEKGKDAAEAIKEKLGAGIEEQAKKVAWK